MPQLTDETASPPLTTQPTHFFVKLAGVVRQLTWAGFTALLDSLYATVGNLALKAPLASPALTGTPTAPTAAAATNTTQLATTQFVRTEVANLVASAPGALDTLDELAAALGDDANFATTVTNALAAKAPLASPALTGVPTAPTAGGGTATTQLATTAFVAAAGVSVAAFVHSGGNDGTAALGSSALPYSTLTGARNALSGKGHIWIKAGSSALAALGVSSGDNLTLHDLAGLTVGVVAAGTAALTLTGGSVELQGAEATDLRVRGIGSVLADTAFRAGVLRLDDCVRGSGALNMSGVADGSSGGQLVLSGVASWTGGAHDFSGADGADGGVDTGGTGGDGGTVTLLSLGALYAPDSLDQSGGAGGAGSPTGDAGSDGAAPFFDGEEMSAGLRQSFLAALGITIAGDGLVTLPTGHNIYFNAA